MRSAPAVSNGLQEMNTLNSVLASTRIFLAYLKPVWTMDLPYF